MPRLLREHFQHMFILVFYSPPICSQIYNTERDLKVDLVSLTFYPPVEDLTKGMDTWEVAKSRYTNFRPISQTRMMQPCKGSTNPSSSDFFPQKHDHQFYWDFRYLPFNLLVFAQLLSHDLFMPQAQPLWSYLHGLCSRLNARNVTSVVRVKNPRSPQLKVKMPLPFLLQFSAIETTVSSAVEERFITHGTKSVVTLSNYIFFEIDLLPTEVRGWFSTEFNSFWIETK